MPNLNLRQDALTIFRAGLRAADPVEAVRRHVRLDGEILNVAGRPYSLHEVDGIRVVGMGKASAAMAEPLVELLGGRIVGGSLNVKYGHKRPLEGIRVHEAGHPVPDEAGREGTEEIIRLLDDAGPRDLVFCLISGGGSALAPAPAPGLTLADKQGVTRRLLECGATIHEINAVRKHLSRVKGGRLAQAAHPATLVSLLLSDVVGDDPDTIASGPTVPDRSTYSDCISILDRYGIRDTIPHAVLQYLVAGDRGEIPETPKAGAEAFRRTQTVVVGSNLLALEAAREEAVRLSYHPWILSSSVQGETREVAKAHAVMAKEILGTRNPVAPPACVISGGETTVTLKGHGIGGRNQEFALAAALEIQGLEQVVILSAGTDGTDGPTDAAGAIADGTTVMRAISLGMDPQAYLDRNDSYPFFQALDDLLMTGPTLTNVMDLRLVMVGD